MISIMLAFFITNLTGNQSPWNTSIANIGGNPGNAPNIITQNLPWMFPALLLVLALATDYLLTMKSQVSAEINFVVATLAYTMISYGAVSGGLETSGYFFLFEFIFLISLFVTILFASRR
jgi:hypothetical protein